MPNNVIPNNTITIPARQKERKQLLARYPGLLCAVARRLVGNERSKYMSRVGRISRVFHGKEKSAPMMAQILRELGRRIDAERKASLREFEQHIEKAAQAMPKLKRGKRRAA